MSDKVIDLRSLQNAIAGKIQLNDGVHDVRRLNTAQYQQSLKPTADPEENIERAVQIVIECVPTVPAELVRSFTPDMLNAIVTLAFQGVAAVEKKFPNGESPETPTSPG